jgi:hypothetical protein
MAPSPATRRPVRGLVAVHGLIASNLDFGWTPPRCRVDSNGHRPSELNAGGELRNPEPRTTEPNPEHDIEQPRTRKCEPPFSIMTFVPLNRPSAARHRSV